MSNSGEPLFFIDLENVKQKYIRINLSTTFPVRTRCKFCGKGPEHYYAAKTAIKWFNPNRSKDLAKHVQKFMKRMIYNYYLIEAPKDFKSTTPYTHTVAYKGYYPTLHKKRNVPAVNDYIEFLCCDCGRSQWSFSQKATSSRPEITQRKARHNYPHKFDDWY
jgi:hypothetical protein